MTRKSRGISPFLILALGICFLFIRNVPFCFILPLWSHGDEIGHLDYALKLSRGHIPQPTEFIEPSLFLLHRTHYDNRILTREKAHSIRRIEELGLAAHSYEAHHPPLPYLLIALFRSSLFHLKVPLLLQVKLLRILSLLSITCGLILIYRGLRMAQVENPVYYSPLLFIPLLAQDVFFSINTDSFSFLFSSLAIMGIILLFQNSHSSKGWALLSAGVILSLWTKASNVFLFIIWPVLILFLWREKKDKKGILYSFIAFFITAALSSPWYVYNQMRFGNYLINSSELSYPLLPPQPLSFFTLKMFILGFMRTLFRGEFIWNGLYFDVIGGWINNAILTVIPPFVLAVGILSYFKYFDVHRGKNFKYLILCGAGIGLVLFLAFISVGGVPYYHARLAFGGLYFIMFVYAAGWRKLTASDGPSLIVPAIWFLSYNLLYAFTLAIKVM